ncbi:DMT family transporter [Spongiivirga sp. MCCC 1A20706]|uniref:DMT family transporter n=1 Tax=Spongiivirga sp. MCCC 1A20706 TaxID=3160963 RepID=UPI003977576A
MNTSKNFSLGILLGIVGVVMFSSKAVMVKLAYNYEVDSVSLLLLRMLFSFPFYVIIAIIYSKEKREGTLHNKHYLWLIACGILGYYLASFFDFEGLQYIKAGLERIILFLYPTIVLILNKLFLKIPITKLQALAIFLTYLGVIFVFWEEVNLEGENVYLGSFLILLSALTYASYIAGSGWLIPKFGVMSFTAYVMIVSCICVFVHYLFTNTTSLFSFQWQVYVLGGAIALIATVIPSFLVSASIKLITSSNFSIVAGIGPISTIIMAYFFLKETLTAIQFLGSFVVIAGILLIKVRKK